MGEKTRYGDGSVRPVDETTRRSRDGAEEPAPDARPSLTFVAGLGGGQGYGVRGYGAASKKLGERQSRAAPVTALGESPEPRR